MTLRAIQPTELCELKNKARILLADLRREQTGRTVFGSRTIDDKADAILAAVLIDIGLGSLIDQYKAIKSYDR